LKGAVPFRIVSAEQLTWEEYERYPGRFRAELTEAAHLRHTRANLIRHEPGAVGPRHAERTQDETFVPLRGTLTMYLGEPPEELVVFVSGAPPERTGADMFESAV
jgi:quercetin dioxygenase-like cupin family protein